MENVNSVCYINKINKITPIEGADKIEQATVNGWNSLVAKDTHKEGDLVLCITTDAVIPQELAEKWGVAQYLRKGNRVRTVKLRKVYSECILIPLSDINEYKGVRFCEGEDMMETLKIFKYEPPVREVSLGGGRKFKYHENPNFHKYHKFPNAKNVPHMFSPDDLVVVTRKIHGTNARYGIVKKSKLSFWDKVRKFFGNRWVQWEYVYGSHNVEKGSDSQGFYSTDVWKTIADKYNIKQNLWKYFKSRINNGYLAKNTSGLIIYGEIYGEGIQGEKYTYGLKGIELSIFDTENDGVYGTSHQTERIAYFLGLPHVEELYVGYFKDLDVDKYILNQYIEGTSVPHEGVVVKYILGDRTKVAKYINPEYYTYSEKHLVPDSH